MALVDIRETIKLLSDRVHGRRIINDWYLYMDQMGSPKTVHWRCRSNSASK